MSGWLDRLGVLIGNCTEFVRQDPAVSAGRFWGWLHDGYSRLVQGSVDSVFDHTGLRIGTSVVKAVHLSVLTASLCWVFAGLKARRRENEHYSKLLETKVPWVTKDRKISHEILFNDLHQYSCRNDCQVALISQPENDIRDQKLALLTVKSIFKLKENFLPETEDYKIYNSSYSIEDTMALIKSLGVLTVSKDIACTVSSYLKRPGFEELGPNVRILSLPPVRDWHWEELETYYLMLRLLDTPDLRSVSERLSLDSRKKLFNLLLNYRDSITREAVDDQYHLGVNMIPKGWLARRIFDTLTKEATRGELEEIARSLQALESTPEQPPVIQQNENLLEAYRDVFMDHEISDYLDPKEYEKLTQERKLIPFILEEMSSLRSRDDIRGNNDIYCVERTLSNFSQKTLVVIIPHSVDADEGYLFRTTATTRHIRGYRYPDIIPDRELSWTYRLSFDMRGHYLYQGTKSKPHYEAESATLKQVLDLTRHGVMFFNWVHEFDASVRYDTRFPSCYSFLNSSVLHETTSFFGFNTFDYLVINLNSYRDYHQKHSKYKYLDCPSMKDYLGSILEVTRVDHDRWTQFCLRHMDTETARKVVINTDPSINSMILAQRYFVRFYDSSHSALGTYDPNATISALLSHWAEHGLCRFKWHRFHTYKILGKLGEEFETGPLFRMGQDKIQPVDADKEYGRTETLGAAVDEVHRSRDIEFYIKLYASVRLRENLVEQMIQAKVSCGLSLDEKDFGDCCKNIRPMPKCVRDIEYGKIVAERKDNYNFADNPHGIGDAGLKQYVHDMLVTQAETFQYYGARPYVYWPGNEVSDNYDQNLSGRGAENSLIAEIRLPDLTKPNEDYDWRSFDIDSLGDC